MLDFPQPGETSHSHRFDHLDSEALGSQRLLWRGVPPDENRPGAGVHDHVITVFVTVVDDDVEIERGGNQASRALHDVDARALESVRDEPALRLHLRGQPSRRRTLGQENDFPPARRGDCRESLDRARLDLAQRQPEVVDGGDMAPELALLTRRQVQVGRAPGQDRAFRRCLGATGSGAGAARSDAPAFAEQNLGLADQRRVHVGEHAVEIESDAERHPQSYRVFSMPTHPGARRAQARPSQL